MCQRIFKGTLMIVNVHCPWGKVTAALDSLPLYTSGPYRKRGGLLWKRQQFDKRNFHFSPAKIVSFRGSKYVRVTWSANICNIQHILKSYRNHNTIVTCLDLKRVSGLGSRLVDALSVLGGVTLNKNKESNGKQWKAKNSNKNKQTKKRERKRERKEYKVE